MKRLRSTPWGISSTRAPVAPRSSATSVLQATTHAAARARLRELAARDLADVARVGAERERDAEHGRGAFGDSGRRVCEIGVDRAYASAAHALDHMRHLRVWSRI